MTLRALAAAAMIAGASGIAAADDHPRVQLELDPCVAVPADEIRRVVAVELGALLSDGADTSADRTRATTSCTGTSVVLRVDDPITAKSLSRTIDLGDAVPSARARLVALAIVELISASWTELEANPRPQVPASGTPPSAGARRAALAVVHARTDRGARPRWGLALVGGGERFATTRTLAGAGLRLARDEVSPIGWLVDVQAHHGSESTALGRITTDVISAGAIAVVHRTWAPATVRLGGGLRGGAVQLAGISDPTAGAYGSRFWAPWWGALVLGSVELDVGHRLTVGATVESGYVIDPVGGLVARQRAVAVDGAWLELALGIGVVL